MPMAANTKAHGRRTSATVKVSKGTHKVIASMATSSMVKLMEKAFSLGATARSTTENGFRASSRGTEYGGAFTMTATSVSGEKAKPMATEFILGKTVTATKANGTCVSSTAQAPIYSSMETRTQANTLMASPKGRASIRGRAVRLTLETLLTE
jgi:hypothetical protein